MTGGDWISRISNCFQSYMSASCLCVGMCMYIDLRHYVISILLTLCGIDNKQVDLHFIKQRINTLMVEAIFNHLPSRKKVFINIFMMYFNVYIFSSKGHLINDTMNTCTFSVFIFISYHCKSNTFFMFIHWITTFTSCGFSLHNKWFSQFVPIIALQHE